MKKGQQPAFPIESLLPLTQRHLAAIRLRYPDSGSEWLDNMIRKSNRREYAAKAMQGLAQNAYSPGWNFLAEDAFNIADAMIEHEEKEGKE